LRALVAGRPKSLVLRELLQNAWDEEGVTQVEVMVTSIHKKILVTVRDDAPEGFYDLRHAYTLFADTRKRANPEQRGRFNLGEKEVLALCQRGYITTTKGTIEFLPNGKRKKLNKKSNSGSEVFVEFEGTRDDYKQMLKEVRTYISPTHINTLINDIPLASWTPTRTIEASLPTEILKDGVLRRSERKTKVEIFELNEDEQPYLYEMGLPVCELGDDQYHLNVMQKVPLGSDRTTVPASYLRTIRAEVTNAMIDDVKEEDASANWVRDALSSKRIESEVVKKVVEKRFGDKAVVATPSDPRSIERAQERGYRIVHPAELAKEEWQNVREAEALPSTGKLFPSSTAPADTIPQSEWTDDQQFTVQSAIWLAKQLLGVDLKVRLIDSKMSSTAADYDRLTKTLRFNVSHISDDEWAHPLKGVMLGLLIHEFGHEGGGHYDSGYHQKLCELAARLPKIVLENPHRFR